MNRKGNPWVSLAALALLAVILVTVLCGCESVEATGTEKPGRFEVVYHQPTPSCTFRIIEDTETGVQYLLTSCGYGGGLTVLQPGDTETEEASQ